jgi:hypothetical protein
MLVFVRPNSSYVRPKLKVIGQMSCQVKYLFAALKLVTSTGKKQCEYNYLQTCNNLCVFTCMCTGVKISANLAACQHDMFTLLLFPVVNKSGTRGMTKGRVTNRRVISKSYDFGELCSNHAHFPQ